MIMSSRQLSERKEDLLWINDHSSLLLVVKLALARPVHSGRLYGTDGDERVGR